MVKTRSLYTLTEKVNTHSKTSDLHQAEMHEIHQKLDAITSVLQTLSETAKSKAGHGLQQ